MALYAQDSLLFFSLPFKSKCFKKSDNLIFALCVYDMTFKKHFLAVDCKGEDSCCSPGRKCKDGHGDCDSNSDCISGKCGTNNCDYVTYPSFEYNDDCCVSGRGNLIFFQILCEVGLSFR